MKRKIGPLTTIEWTGPGTYAGLVQRGMTTITLVSPDFIPPADQNWYIEHHASLPEEYTQEHYTESKQCGQKGAQANGEQNGNFC